MKVNPACLQPFLGQIQEAGELTENKRLVAVRNQFIDELEQRVQFRTTDRTRDCQSRITRGAAQPHNLRQHMKTRVSPAARHCADRLKRLRTQRGVKGHFVCRRLDAQGDLGTFGQIGQDLRLGSPQQEGTQQSA